MRRLARCQREFYPLPQAYVDVIVNMLSGRRPLSSLALKFLPLPFEDKFLWLWYREIIRFYSLFFLFCFSKRGIGAREDAMGAYWGPKWPGDGSAIELLILCLLERITAWIEIWLCWKRETMQRMMTREACYVCLQLHTHVGCLLSQILKNVVINFVMCSLVAWRSPLFTVKR